MKTNGIVLELQERANKLKEELSYIEGLLKVYGATDKEFSIKESSSNDFVPELKPQARKTETLTSKARKGIRELMQYPLSYKKEDIEYNLEKMGYEDITKATLHNALRDLRDEGVVIGYKLNRSNQMVWYMSSDGKDYDDDIFPVKSDYVPQDIEIDDIDEFQFL